MGYVELGKKLGGGERDVCYMRLVSPSVQRSTVSVPEDRYDDRGTVRTKDAARSKGSSLRNHG